VATNQARIIATNQNLAKLQTSGVDITANYNHKIKDYGSLNLNVIGTYLKEFVTEPIRAGRVRLRRLLRDDLRHSAAGLASQGRVTWSTRGAWTWRSPGATSAR